MKVGEGAADEVVLVGTAEQRTQTAILSQRPTLRCIGCARPTDRLQGVCIECLRWHFRLDALTRAKDLGGAP